LIAVRSLRVRKFIVDWLLRRYILLMRLCNTLIALLLVRLIALVISLLASISPKPTPGRRKASGKDIERALLILLARVCWVGGRLIRGK
jgi:hypothetical protein